MIVTHNNRSILFIKKENTFELKIFSEITAIDSIINNLLNPLFILSALYKYYIPTDHIVHRDSIIERNLLIYIHFLRCCLLM